MQVGNVGLSVQVGVIVTQPALRVEGKAECSVSFICLRN